MIWGVPLFLETSISMQDFWTINTSTPPPTSFNELQPDSHLPSVAVPLWRIAWRRPWWIFFPRETAGDKKNTPNNKNQDEMWMILLERCDFLLLEFKVAENTRLFLGHFFVLWEKIIACIFACFFFNSNFFATGFLFASRCALLLSWGLVKQFGVPSSYLPKGGWSPISMGEYESVNIFLWLQGLHDIRGSLKKAGNSWAQWNVTNFFSEPRVRNGRPASSDCLRHAESRKMHPTHLDAVPS